MYLVATVALAVALALLLILGFLRVARELLSRGIYEVPSRNVRQASVSPESTMSPH